MDVSAHGLDDVLAHLDWREKQAQLDAEGFALLPGLFGPEQAAGLAALAVSPNALRAARLEDMDLGRGTTHAFGEPLPPMLDRLRSAVYRHLAPIANRWNNMQDIPQRFPEHLNDFLGALPQTGYPPASRLTRLLQEDLVALHYCAGAGAGSKSGSGVGASAAVAASPDTKPVFPLQVVALLSRPGEDFDGGEFVMTEQRPRMQSRPSVVPLQHGDAAIICIGQRPIEGDRGIYRVTMRHAISRVRRGERVGLELSFQAYALPPG